MHIDIVPNRGSRPAVLLRESYREGTKVKKRTLANLSELPMDQVEAIRRVLKGEQLVPSAQLFECIESRHHGHVQAVTKAMERLGFGNLIDARRSRERDLVVALVASRILAPASKLATTRWWHATTLAESLSVSDANDDEVYAAMDWLLERQDAIEKKLAKRHLSEGGLVLFDLTSSYFEGSTCPLAKLGYSRDGKKGKLQVNYGLLTDGRGCPVAVSVFEGNTGDPKTLMPQVEKLRGLFNLKRFVLVGDRGMISQKQINAMKSLDGIDWITALKTPSLRKLADGGHLQFGLFDERNLLELTHPDFPGERLIACRNTELGKLRAHKRSSLLDATVGELEKIRAMTARGRLVGRAKIGVRVGRVINKYKVAKHIRYEIRDDGLDFSVDEESVAGEAALDGLYVVRTSLGEQDLDSADTVRSYKKLSAVERAFRSLKTVDLKVRPIHHHLEDRVRAHILLCMLAYYVEWHMTEAWRPVLFADEDQAAKTTRDPVAPATRSAEALAKVDSKELPDGSPVHSFKTLLAELSTIVKNRCRAPGAPEHAATFDVTTTPSPAQLRALQLLENIRL